MLQKLPSSSQLHLGKPLSAVDTDIKSEQINSPGANALNIASKWTVSFSTLFFSPFVAGAFQVISKHIQNKNQAPLSNDSRVPSINSHFCRKPDSPLNTTIRSHLFFNMQIETRNLQSLPFSCNLNNHPKSG